MMSEPIIRYKTLADYQPAMDNPNQHNERGLQAIEDSINHNGAGRSGLAANDGTLLAGNGTWEAMQRAGVEDVLEIEIDGKQWVVVKRRDLDPTDARAKSLMIADNRASQLDFTPDMELLGAVLADIAAQDAALVKAAGYNQAELNTLLEGAVDDPYAEWQGMPEFEQDDKTALKSILVHFATEDDLEAFSRLINQTLTMRTKSVWYPAKEKQDLTKEHWINES